MAVEAVLERAHYFLGLENKNVSAQKRNSVMMRQTFFHFRSAYALRSARASFCTKRKRDWLPLSLLAAFVADYVTVFLSLNHFVEVILLLVFLVVVAAAAAVVDVDAVAVDAATVVFHFFSFFSCSKHFVMYYIDT